MKLWDALDLGDICDVYDAFAGPESLRFPCGLEIPKDQAQSDVASEAGAVAVHNAHLEHHQQDHMVDDYQIIPSVMEVSMAKDAPYVTKVVASCNCGVVEQVEEILG